MRCFYWLYHEISYLFRHRLRRIPFRLKNGFWPSETWNLDVEIGKWLAPRLKYYRDNRAGYPSLAENFTDESWHAILTEMIETFEYAASHLTKNHNCNWETDGFEADRKLEEENLKKFQKGIDLFAKYYMGLWD